MTARRRLATPLALAGLVLVAAVLAGCGLLGGSTGGGSTSTAGTTASRIAGSQSGGGATTTTTTGSGPSASTRAKVAQADRTGEYPAAGTTQRVLGGWRTPDGAVRAFATTYINWTATTVAARLTALAEVSVGQARSIVSLGASQTAQDYELRHGGIANSGTVEAITPQPGAAGRYIVVTRERTTSTNSAAYRGLAPAWHVTLASVTTVDGRNLGRLWVLSGWQPES